MAKETKSLRKQADKAERMARVAADAEISESLRSQADVLKAKRKQEKKRRRPTKPQDR